MSDLLLEGKRILLLGSNERAALSVCRSLGRQGAVVEIVAFEALRQPAELSRYCKKRLFFGAPVTDPAGFLERLLRHLDETRYDAVFPMTDVACEVVYADYPALASRTVVIGPDPVAYRQAVDKGKAVDLAARVGLQAPAGVLLRDGDDTAPGFAMLKDGPVYAKPVRSCLLSDGFIHTFDVKKCTAPEQLERKLAEDLSRVPVLVQQAVAGHGVGLNFLAMEGQLIAVSMNRRLHEPRDGGGSSFRTNVGMSEQHLQVARDIAQALKWSGLIMVELKQDGDALTIMELNCRPWGSIETAIRAGVDFPSLAAAQALDVSRPATLVQSDRPAKVRNLKNDLRWVIEQRRRWFTRPSPLLDWLGAPFRAMSGREQLDIEQSDYLWPAIRQFNPLLNRVWRRGRLALRMVITRMGYRHQYRQLDPQESLLFLCQGNINRSATAELLFRQAGFSRVRSAGMLPLRNRRISPAAGRFLKTSGCDGSAHRSRTFQESLDFVAEGAKVVVFDFRTMADVLIAHPDVRDQVVMFDDLSRDKTGELRDPHGTSEADYQACFDRIEATLRDQTGGRGT
jgi:protein-tyrosine-phosphatase/predicted ATP-grasp superfamily ATP-dependent carboligase